MHRVANICDTYTLIVVRVQLGHFFITMRCFSCMTGQSTDNL